MSMQNKLSKLFRIFAAMTVLAMAFSQAGGTANARNTSGPSREKTPISEISLGEVFAYYGRMGDVKGPVGIVVELNDTPAALVYSQANSTAGAEQAAVNQAAMIAQKQIGFMSDLQAKGVNTSQLFSAQKSYNGIWMRVDTSALKTIAAMPGVKAIHPIIAKEIDNSTSVPLIGAPQVWGGSGTYQGDNIRIGIIDTGIDYAHTNFGGAGTYPGTFPSAKVVGGWDFVGDAYNANVPTSIPTPDPDPMDCNGHGSHVAGTAAGFGVKADGTTYVESGPDTYAALKDLTSSAYISKFRIGPGVAPKADLYALRVFGCAGSTNVVVEALEWAMDPDGDGNVSDHLDVVNMSLGSPYGSVTDPDAVAADNAVKAGIIVVASAGNSGDVYYVTGSPAVSPYTISVASSVDAGAVLSAFEVTANTAPSALMPPNKYPASLATFGPQTFNVTGDLAYLTTTDLGCTAYPAGTFTGKIALINRGTCSFDVKVTNAQNAGAIGVLLANNTDTFPAGMGASGTVPNPLIPVMMTTKSLGTSIKTDMLAGTVTVLLTSDFPNSVFMSDPTVVDTVSSFSSRGPARGGTTLKPDISAPGDTVFSTANGTGNKGASFNGTSMAAPHIAGVMALLRQLHPDWTVAELKALAMNTATNDLYAGLNLTGNKHTPTRQGAGRVDVPKATLSNVVAYNKINPEMVSVSYGFVEVVNSLVGVDKTITKSIILSNLGGSAESYNVTFDSRYTSVPNPGLTFTLLNAGNTAISNPVTVPAYGTLEIKVKVDIDAATLTRARDATISTAGGRERFSEGGGYVVLTSTATAPMVRVPVHIAARPASSMGTVETQINLPAAVSGTFSLTPSGIPVDTADDGSLVYISELLYQSPNETSSTFSNNAADLKYIGATSDYAGTIAGSSAYISIATHGVWDSLSTVEFDVYFDTNEDGFDDYVLYNTNSGTSSSPTDTMVSVLCDLPVTGCFIADYVNWFGGGTNTNAFLNDAMTMDVLLGDLGLVAGVNTGFDFYVVSFTREAASYVDVSATMHYDVANQSFSSSGILGTPAWDDNILYSPTLNVSYNKTNIEANGSTGLLLLHQHNATNTAQAVALAPKNFTDVSRDYYAAPYIDSLYKAGITIGCGSGNFCPETNIPRDQMAVLLVRAKHGPSFVPPTATGIFSDVPVGSFAADFIEQLAADGVTAGCGGGNYCPSGLVTRAEMAIFLVRATHGAAFVPPTATGIFSDVPVGSFGANFIEQLAADGVTAGCGGGNYCPNANITRAQTAILLVKAFNLPFP